MVNRYNKSYEGSPNSRQDAGGSGKDITKRCGKNLVVSKGSETREAHYLGPVLVEFLQKVFP